MHPHAFQPPIKGRPGAIQGTSPFASVDGICGVTPGSSGLVSLVIQAVALSVSVFLTAMLFLHIGGTKMLFSRSETIANSTLSTNSTDEWESSAILSMTDTPQLSGTIPFPDEIHGYESMLQFSGGEGIAKRSPSHMAPPTSELAMNNIIEGSNTTIDLDDEVQNLLDPAGTTEDSPGEQQDVDDNDGELENRPTATNGTVDLHSLNPFNFIDDNGPFEQIREVRVRIGTTEVELLPLLRVLCIAYAVTCGLWLISLIGLLISLKHELLDLVYLNTLLLATVSIFTLVKALIVGILIFQQAELRWKVMLVICITVGGLLVAFIFDLLAFSQLVVWYRYIDYNSAEEEKCACIAAIASCIKGHVKRDRRGGIPAPADYSIPEATRHPHLPYIDDAPIQQFHNIQHIPQHSEHNEVRDY